MSRLHTIALMAACTVVFKGYAQKGKDTKLRQKNKKELIIWNFLDKRNQASCKHLSEINKQSCIIGFVYKKEIYFNFQGNLYLDDPENDTLARKIFKLITDKTMFKKTKFTYSTHASFKEVSSIHDKQSIISIDGLKYLQRNEDKTLKIRSNPRLFYMKFASSEDLPEEEIHLSDNSGIMLLDDNTETQKKDIHILKRVELYPLTEKNNW